MTIFGLYGRNDGALPIAALIAMLGTLGYDASGVRSSVARLKAKGFLQSEREDRVAKYRVSETATGVFREGDQRIFDPEPRSWSSMWVLAVFSVPETMRNRRYQLRTELSKIGFGCVSSGTWIAPAHVLEQAKARLTRRGLMQFVDLFLSDHVSAGTTKEKVAVWWDLEYLDGQYQDFLFLYGAEGQRWAALSKGETAQASDVTTVEDLIRDAFRCYVPMLTMWRQFPYRDPHLPPDYLPQSWHGPAAWRSFTAIHTAAAPLAEAYARNVIGHATLGSSS
ncbi:PaaX family transcriptional regulator C-terminal domain-containing protein [Paenarthrobacter sp. NPDC058040]|uniref:PaaX family transcriptional regulator n=1 Tax=unclassified Paenarthrobacter TaxID=2634190 RepID=UPI0036D8A1D7